MSRPLVIKVTSANPKHNTKASGSINVALLRERQTSSPDRAATTPENHESAPSLVRNLVNRYESSRTTTLLKHRSKSMIDISPLKIERPKAYTTQDDTLHHKIQIDNEVFEDWRQNFHEALSKFQKSPGKSLSNRTEKAGARNIQLQAKRLLQVTKHDYFWFNEVIDLLHIVANEEIPALNNSYTNVQVPAALSNNHNDNESSEDIQSESNLKVSEIKRMYEDKVAQINPPSHTENVKDVVNEVRVEKKVEEQKVKLPLKYFGQQNEESDASTLTDNEETRQDDEYQLQTQTITQMSETGEPDEEKDEYSHEFDAYEDPDEPILLHSTDNEDAIETVEEMLRKIEECDRKIDFISEENKLEANLINDILIQVLIKLDDLKVHDDGVIVSMRRRAFAFTQDCIQKLKDKVF